MSLGGPVWFMMTLLIYFAAFRSETHDPTQFYGANQFKTMQSEKIA